VKYYYDITGYTLQYQCINFRKQFPTLLWLSSFYLIGMLSSIVREEVSTQQKSQVIRWVDSLWNHAQC